MSEGKLLFEPWVPGVQASFAQWQKKNTSNIQKGEKILESLFTFYLSSADFSSIWQIYSDKKKL